MSFTRFFMVGMVGGIFRSLFRGGVVNDAVRLVVILLDDKLYVSLFLAVAGVEIE